MNKNVVDMKNSKKNNGKISSYESNSNKYFSINGMGMKFEPMWLVNDIVSQIHLVRDHETLLYYNNGVYKPTGDEVIKKFALKLLEDEARKSRIEEVHYLIKKENYAPHTVINPNDGLINVKNGLLDWKTGELLPHTHERISTIQIPVEYHPHAEDENVINFIKSIVPEDTVETVIEMIGYCLLPSRHLHKTFILTGSGANGKSTLINLIDTLIGKDNVTHISLQELESDRFASARLKGILLNTCADIPAKGMEKSDVFKKITGGDPLTAQNKYEKSFEFDPICKLIFSANDIPQSADTTDGFFRRLIIIPFPNKFEGSKRDNSLLDKLTTPEALSALLNYAIVGLKRLEANGGFTEGETLKHSLEQYKRNSDTVRRFIEECCVLAQDEYTKTKDVSDTYKIWCRDMNLKATGTINFNEKLENTYNLSKNKRKVNGKVSEYWNGIRLKTIEDDLQQEELEDKFDLEEHIKMIREGRENLNKRLGYQSNFKRNETDITQFLE